MLVQNPHKLFLTYSIKQNDWSKIQNQCSDDAQAKLRLDSKLHPINKYHFIGSYDLDPKGKVF